MLRPALENRNNIRILVVDDDPNEMKSLVIGLKLEGFKAIGVASGPDALSALGKSSFSAVLIDLMMPEMNGLQLARAVRSNHPSTVTFLMSAYHLSPVQLARADTGVVGFIPKPFSFEKLVDFIQLKIAPDTKSASSASVAMPADTGLHTPIDVAKVISET